LAINLSFSRFAALLVFLLGYIRRNGSVGSRGLILPLPSPGIGKVSHVPVTFCFACFCVRFIFLPARPSVHACFILREDGHGHGLFDFLNGGRTIISASAFASWPDTVLRPRASPSLARPIISFTRVLMFCFGPASPFFETCFFSCLPGFITVNMGPWRLYPHR
jgi:hypothetical protein